MAHWLEKIITILNADTSDLRELAILAGGDPKTFYLGVDVTQIDFQHQNIDGMEFSRPAQKAREPAKQEATLEAFFNWRSNARALQRMKDLMQELVETRDEALKKRFEAEAGAADVTAQVAEISYELRGPLTTVVGMGDLLLADADLNQKQRERVMAIISAATTLQSLTNDITNMDWRRIRVNDRLDIAPRKKP